MEEQWIINQIQEPPDWFIKAVKHYNPAFKKDYGAQLLWQRGIRNISQLDSFINFHSYQPASPWEFGQEIQLGIERLESAYKNQENVTIWGDFDADGITSTAILWDGLGQFFTQNNNLTYYIPNRLTESHGLNYLGIDKLAQQNCKLIVTCDTGSTNTSEIIYAKSLGMDVIVTDHHTLPESRPPVTAIINPRYLSQDHPLYHLSGVGVAYKLIEAMYETLPSMPQQPIEDLLDLVAIGLIADLVQLSGDCRYLAQFGIQKLFEDFKKNAESRRRPGVGRLLELCQGSGDRPTDISFGLGPRINAVSRIQGKSNLCVELLTSRNHQRVYELAEITELANTRRKSLQKNVVQQVKYKLSHIDLSTTSVIVLADSQWAIGVLGLVAGQIAQETGRPTILLSLQGKNDILARGSARSINSVDLYQLVSEQAHLLHNFGGHPFAAGLSLKVENIPLFTQAINQKLRQTLEVSASKLTVTADLKITVADLGRELFTELKLLEPYGMGNPVPKLLIEDCWFENIWHRNQQDSKGKKVQYIKTDFCVRDNSTNIKFPGVWWGHYKDELPLGKCDCVVELDYNTYKNRCEVRIITVRASQKSFLTQPSVKIVDWRNFSISSLESSQELTSTTLLLSKCPSSWNDLWIWVSRNLHNQQILAVAWNKPKQKAPVHIWMTLVGVAKYLSHNQKLATRSQLLEKLQISDQCLHFGIQALRSCGFDVKSQEHQLKIMQSNHNLSSNSEDEIRQFLAAIREEQFQQQYFAQVNLSIIQTMASPNVISVS